MLTLSLTAPCGWNALTAKMELCPQNAWAHQPTAVRSFPFYANHVAASVHSATVQYQAQKSAFEKTRVVLKSPLRPNRMSDLKNENRFRIPIQKSIICLFKSLSSDDAKRSCWRIITGSQVRHTHIPGGQIFKIPAQF